MFVIGFSVLVVGAILFIIVWSDTRVFPLGVDMMKNYRAGHRQVAIVSTVLVVIGLVLCLADISAFLDFIASQPPPKS